ncbi:MAG: mechanosensitive ion channel, partial [Gammaproteobacteria bacterium]|nr:mechanosensitive ion channel [Gammaproteobacteria bacterium]
MDKSPVLKTTIILLLAAAAAVLGLYTEHTYIKAAVVLVLALATAQLIELVVENVIHRLVGKTNNTLDDKLVGGIHRPLFWSVILLGLVIALSTAAVSPGLEQVVRSVVFSILVFLWMLFTLQVSRIVLHSISRRRGRTKLVSSQTLPLFTNLAAVIIVALGVYFIFQAWKIDMTAWLASAGIIGIAVGFAAKD